MRSHQLLDSMSNGIFTVKWRHVRLALCLATVALCAARSRATCDEAPRPSSDDALTFYCDFDGTADATIAVGDKTATCAVPPKFEKGVRGQAVVVGGDPKGKQRIEGDVPKRSGKARNCLYASKGNIELRNGTVSFWMKPLDWKGKDDGFNVIFYTHAGDNYFQIYKYWTDDRFIFLRGKQGKWTEVHFKIRDWEPDQWHHVAVTWNPAGMRMFIDGRKVCSRRVRFPLELAKGDVEPISVGPGGSWSKAFIGRSLVDEFRIHDRSLSENEIVELYLRDADAVDVDSGTVTIGMKTPALDGAIKDFEYSFDSSGLVPKGESYSPEISRYALGYDEKNLYLSVLTRLDEKNGKSERVVLLLRPGGRGQPLQRFTFTPAGLTKAVKTGAPDWKAEGVQVENAMTDGVWVFEAAIPFAALGVEEPPNGGNWRFNLVRRNDESDRTASLAPVAGSMDDQSHFITLGFRPDAPAIQVTDRFDAEKGTLSEGVSARGTDDQSAITYERVSDTTEEYGLKSHSHPLFAKGRSTPYQSPAWRTGAGTDFSLRDRKIVEKRGGLKTILHQRRTISESDDPLKVFFLHAKDKKQLRVCAMRRAETGKIQARFLDGQGNIAFQAIQPLPTDATYFNALFDLDLDTLKPGAYLVEIDYVGPKGKASKAWEQDFRIPAPDAPDLKPYVDEEADKVPAPWTPVEVEKADADEISVATWGRNYAFSKNILFSSLISQGEEILAAPASLRLNGETLSPVEPVKLSDPKRSDVTAEWTQTAKLGGLDVESDVKVHFDGYCEVAMTLSPTESTPEIKALSLDVPLRAEAATMVRDNKLSKLIGGKSGTVGDYWFQTLTGRPFLWVGNDSVGFNWLAPDLKEWRGKENSKRVELIRKGDVVALRFNVIDVPTKLTTPMTIRFGFALTPTRPLDERILRKRCDKEYQMWCQPWKRFAVPEYETADLEEIKRKGEGHDEVFLYLGVSLTSAFSPEWPWFAEEWRGKKRNFGKWTNFFQDLDLRRRHCYVGGPLDADSFFNWMQHKRNAFFKKAKTPLTPKALNYYFDTGVSTSARYREQALNVYRMIKRTGPNAKIWGHQGWLRAMPMQHFAEIIVGGEGWSGPVGTKGGYYDLLTPDLFRATFSPYIWGMKMVFLDLNVRILKEQHPDKLLAFNLDDPKYRRPLLHSYGYCLTHDVDIHDTNKESAPLRETIWAAQDALGWDEKVTFHPYWKNDAVKLVAPDSNRVLASAYGNNGKLLLAVLNDTDQKQTVALELDLKKIGVKPGLKGGDEFDLKATYELGETWKGEFGPRQFRLISFPKIEARQSGNE